MTTLSRFSSLIKKKRLHNYHLFCIPRLSLVRNISNFDPVQLNTLFTGYYGLCKKGRVCSFNGMVSYDMIRINLFICIVSIIMMVYTLFLFKTLIKLIISVCVIYWCGIVILEKNMAYRC